MMPASLLTSIRNLLILLMTAVFMLSYLDVPVSVEILGREGQSCCVPGGACNCPCCSSPGGNRCCAHRDDHTGGERPASCTFKRGGCTSQTAGTVPQMTKEFCSPAPPAILHPRRTQRYVSFASEYHFVPIYDAFHPPRG